MPVLSDDSNRFKSLACWRLCQWNKSARYICYTLSPLTEHPDQNMEHPTKLCQIVVGSLSVQTKIACKRKFGGSLFRLRKENIAYSKITEICTDCGDSIIDLMQFGCFPKDSQPSSIYVDCRNHACN